MAAAPVVQLQQDLLSNYLLWFAQLQSNTGEGQQRIEEAERSWAMIDRVPPVVPEGQGIPGGDLRWNEALYRRAVSEFERALQSIEDFRQQLQQIDTARQTLRDPTWWKALDEMARLDRRQTATTLEFHRQQTYWWSRTLATLGRMDRPALHSQSRVVDLRKRALRLYAVNEIALGYYAPALRLLEEYAEFPEVETEWPLHYYLSRCYGGELRRARQDRGIGEAELRELRRRRNLHFLRAVELKFGRPSPEWDETMRRTILDELGTPRR
ncbi:MAG: hypothetical protein K1X75_09200 [Leptospirales bacterium]|nr:hypothetical protein [Leptospirales bacterium]